MKKFNYIKRIWKKYFFRMIKQKKFNIQVKSDEIMVLGGTTIGDYTITRNYYRRLCYYPKPLLPEIAIAIVQ